MANMVPTHWARCLCMIAGYAMLAKYESIEAHPAYAVGSPSTTSISKTTICGADRFKIQCITCITKQHSI